MSLCLARSLAGHDKDALYVILKEENGYVWLVNGTTRKVDDPKKKKLKHIQAVIHPPESIRNLEPEDDIYNDLTVIKILKEYSKNV